MWGSSAGLIHEIKIIYYLPVVIDDAPQFRWSNWACIVKPPGDLFAYFVLNLFIVKCLDYFFKIGQPSWLQLASEHVSGSKIGS